MNSIFRPLILSAIFIALLMPAIALSGAKTGLKIPTVPITGGKKLKVTDKGDVAGVEPMPGISKHQTVSWETLTGKYFDLKRTLPEPKPQELISTRGMMKKEVVSTIDLPKMMRSLHQKSFTDAKYGANEEWVKSFGNIVNAFKQIKGNAKKTDALLTKLSNQYPAIYKEVSAYLPQLVRDDFLYSKKWDPYKDESVKGKQNDGILFVDHWYMQADPKRHKVWNENLGEHKVYQAAAVLYADLNTIKEMERNYANYFSQVGQDYLEVYPVPNSLYRGVDNRGNEFYRMNLFLRNDLPFPYDSASYVMNICEHYLEDGTLVADYYSENRDDLNWMAGRDTYYKIETTKNELVGWMIVTTLDFDIKNVPERDIDRIVSMKAGLGNMKRISEQLMDKKMGQASR